jgi:peptidoglycan/xylan/chitin deacetylase (PgdA/CDA1 family)
MKSIWLMYHDIYEGPGPASVRRSATMYHASKKVFGDHLQAVKDSGLRVVTVGEFIASGGAPGDTAVLTFDDGWAGAFRVAIPILERMGWRATFFVTSDFIGRAAFCQREMIQRAVSAGMEIGIHGATHRFLSSCTATEVKSEFARSKGILEDIAGSPIEHASAPGGSTSGLVAECAASAGLQSMATSRPGVNHSKQPHYALRRVAIRASTTASDIARYCRFDVTREQFRWQMLQLPRALLGMKRYAQLRRVLLMDHSPAGFDVFEP